MKSIVTLFLAAAILTGWAFAQVPQKAPISRYTGLWMNSPFTSKPPPSEAGPLVNPLEDFVLLGVSPIRGGYRVTMMEKKAPDKRITVDSDNTASSYKILSVARKPGDALGTTVQMSIGTSTGTVGYDQETLTLAAAAPPQPPIPGQPPVPMAQPQLQPQPQANGQQPVRQPRPRVVPPPTAMGGPPKGSQLNGNPLQGFPPQGGPPQGGSPQAGPPQGGKGEPTQSQAQRPQLRGN